MSKNIQQGAAACLALCAAALHPVQAQTSVQVYGRLNVSAERVRASQSQASQTQSGARLVQTRISNNRSVLGFRGSEDLGGGLTALFQVEGTLSPDTGAGEIARRDTRLGLEGGFGTVFLGHWTTAYNGATAGLDPFYPTTAGYMSIMGNGAAPSADNVSNLSSFDRRQANSVHYWSRPWNGLALRVSHGVSEERPASGAKPSLSSVAAIYDRGRWYAALAHERHEEYQGPGTRDQGSKLALAYSVGGTRVAVVAERLEYELAAGKLERDALYLSLSQQLGAHGLRAGLAWADDGKGAPGSRIGFVRAGPDTGAWHLTLGWDYTLSKRTSIYAYASRLDNEAAGAYDFAINSLGAAPGAALTGTAFGLRHAF
ncbi:porin [Massilia sp. KIM]|uniref:porin n=1 Tax=Massilia sp. KIM TaxID=1955422 RepID=UPI00098F85ED|nr:porin [Massilia sp. KIM]OON59218.1 porin [Massilia sp. KIM]